MKLFEEWKLRDIRFRNRIGVSPMCQYSCVDGLVNDWHLVHLGSRAVGGAGLIIAEASAVEARGRISPGDAGIYNDEHVSAWKSVTDFIRAQGAVAGIQLAHAGRKASTAIPWRGPGPVEPAQGGWLDVVGPSALAFDAGYCVPHALATTEILAIVQAFKTAARRAVDAGFQAIEVHAAHGYLLHSFLSPLSNTRSDSYGGAFENRIRFLTEVVDEVRAVVPAGLPVLVRISASDWAPGGWDIEESVMLAKNLKNRGVDLIDVSSGGLVPHAKITVGPGYQVPFAERIRKEAGMSTAAVGMITRGGQAQEILEKGQADMILLAREFLRDAYWPRRAAQELGEKFLPPAQYGRS